DLSGVRIAVTDRPDSAPVTDDVLEGTARAQAALKDLGAVIVKLPAAEDLAKSDYDVILIAEARAYHESIGADPEDYRPSTREFLAPGAAPLPVDLYLAAQQRRLEVTAAWQTWFETNQVQAILEPSSATT